jgi:hypothetical protein
MDTYLNSITIKMQIVLNKRMYELKKISYDTYSKANEVLVSRLIKFGDNDIIAHSEMIQTG